MWDVTSIFYLRLPCYVFFVTFCFLRNWTEVPWSSLCIARNEDFRRRRHLGPHRAVWILPDTSSCFVPSHLVPHNVPDSHNGVCCLRVTLDVCTQFHPLCASKLHRKWSVWHKHCRQVSVWTKMLNAAIRVALCRRSPLWRPSRYHCNWGMNCEW